MSVLAFVLLLVLLSGLPPALAIGIRPAKTTIITEKTTSMSGEFWVVNNEHRDFSVRVYASGDMSQYVGVNTKELVFSNDDAAKVVEFTVKLPGTVPPGESLAYIIVEEALQSSEPDVISSKVLLKHKIVIHGEYPDKYVEVDLNFQEKPDAIRMVSVVENKGKEDIGTIKTTFRVNDQELNEHVLETVEASLKAKESKLLDAEIAKGIFGNGEYTISAVTTYDDFEIEQVKEMKIGKPEIDIAYFDKYFIEHKINPYSMDLENKWNKEIRNVFVDVDVKKDNKKIDEFRTKSVDIGSETTERINDYFDARDKDKGTYTFDMIVNFWNSVRMETKTFTSELLSEEDAQKFGIGELGAQSSSSGISVWAVIGGLIAVVCAGGLFFYLRSKKDAHPQEST